MAGAPTALETTVTTRSVDCWSFVYQRQQTKPAMLHFMPECTGQEQPNLKCSFQSAWCDFASPCHGAPFASLLLDAGVSLSPASSCAA